VSPVPSIDKHVAIHIMCPYNHGPIAVFEFDDGDTEPALNIDLTPWRTGWVDTGPESPRLKLQMRCRVESCPTEKYANEATLDRLMKGARALAEGKPRPFVWECPARYLSELQGPA
jgi:hypothetical protein